MAQSYRQEVDVKAAVARELDSAAGRVAAVVQGASKLGRTDHDRLRDLMNVQIASWLLEGFVDTKCIQMNLDSVRDEMAGF